MREIDYTKARLLRERIEQNYENFKKAVLQLDKGDIFKYASSIAAANDVYSYMTTHDWADGDETNYLLKFENPLKLLSEAWEEYSEDRGGDFGRMLTETVENAAEDYMPFSVTDELREKYGADMPLNTAALIEFVELGKRIFNLRDDGDDEDYYDEDDDDYWYYEYDEGV